MKSKANNKLFKSMNGQVFYETAEQLRAQVHQEINANRIEPTVIERSPKDEVRKAKRAWKKNPVRDNEVMLALTQRVEKRIRFNVRFNAL